MPKCSDCGQRIRLSCGCTPSIDPGMDVTVLEGDMRRLWDAIQDTDFPRNARNRLVLPLIDEWLGVFNHPTRKTVAPDAKTRKRIYRLDGYRCVYCGVAPNAYGMTIDHVDPDGGNDDDNLVTSCRRCNSRKGSRTPEQAGMTMRHGRFAGAQND